MSILDQISYENEPQRNNHIMYGIAIAKVTNINDPDGLGRVKCRLIIEENDKEQTEWIRVATFMGGKERGAFFLPEVGDEVILAFDNGDIHRPYVIGCLWSKEECPAPHKIEGDKNDIRKIKSRAGSEFIFNDKKGEESIKIHTPKERDILMDDGKEIIRINDKDNKNILKLESSSGTITIQAEKKIVLQSGNCKITLDGNANAITIESGGSLKEKSNQVMVEAQGMMTLKSSSMLDIKSDAVINIKGNMVKIN